MNQHYLRIFKSYNLDEVKKGLLITGDVTGNCAACSALGIDPYQAKTCPECGTPFRFIASRRLETHPGERFQLARRFAEKRPDLILIDLSDYQKATGAKTARDFFGV